MSGLLAKVLIDSKELERLRGIEELYLKLERSRQVSDQHGQGTSQENNEETIEGRRGAKQARQDTQVNANTQPPPETSTLEQAGGSVPNASIALTIAKVADQAEKETQVAGRIASISLPPQNTPEAEQNKSSAPWYYLGDYVKNFEQ